VIKIIYREKRPGEWYDIEDKRVRNGIIYSFVVIDEMSKRTWLFNVRYCDDKAVVIPVASDRTTLLNSQIKSKSDVFKEVYNDPSKFYHVLGVSYVENNRLKYKRIKNYSEIPSIIRNNFEIKLYKDVCEVSIKGLEDKYVVIVNKNNVEEMVKLFIYEKVHPVSKHL